MNNFGETIDFEDFFYTREGIELAIRDLYRSFDSIYQANKKNKYIINEYKAFKAWADKSLKEGAPLFGGGTAVDEWKQRYKKAYSYADKKAGPDPNVYDKPLAAADLLNNPWVWIGGAILLSVVIGRLTR